MKIHTIGHSDHTKEDFLEMLQYAEIGYIADVRAFPYSKKHPQFNGDISTETVEAAGAALHRSSAPRLTTDGTTSLFIIMLITLYPMISNPEYKHLQKWQKTIMLPICVQKATLRDATDSSSATGSQHMAIKSAISSSVPKV